MDARLEYGVEMGVEISLRILATFGIYNLPHSINATIHVSNKNRKVYVIDRFLLIYLSCCLY